MDKLNRYIDEVGVGAFARRVGVSYQAVRKWQAKGRVPPSRALDIERATAGYVSRADVCPELFKGWRRARSA